MRLIDADSLDFSSLKHEEYPHYIADEIVERAPAVEAEPVKHGRWVKDHDGDEYCENCYRYMPDREVTGDPCATNYCPNCGAKMDLEVADEQS